MMAHWSESTPHLGDVAPNRAEVINIRARECGFGHHLIALNGHDSYIETNEFKKPVQLTAHP